MFSFFYNLALGLFALVALPKLLWQWCTLGKYRESLSARLGLTFPSFSPKPGQKVIWIHVISMGETRAVIPLFRLLRQAYPDYAIVFSNTTETGHAEAKRSMPEAEAHFFLPLDFSWIIRRLFNRIQPTLLILCESDFWYHLIKTAHERQIPIALVNGKISERSCHRFQKVPFFTQRIFSLFDLLCVQSERYRQRFLSLKIPPEKLIVTGNLKFDVPSKKLSSQELSSLKITLGIQEEDRILVLGSTHAPEEEELLVAIQPLFEQHPSLKVLIVPRHPERFNEVAQLLQRKNISFGRLSGQQPMSQRVLLIDAMGVLTQCYQVAALAIVGGSYVSHVGGHNILEPVQYGVPVLFGPYMHSQPDLKDLILTAEAGQQVPLNQLTETLHTFLSQPALYQRYTQACQALTQSVQGSSQRTLEILKKAL